jgi:Rad3-related DNA helicase
MFTAELHPAALAQARSSPTAAQHAPVKKALDKVRRAWVALDKAHPDPYTVLEAFPDKLLATLQQCTTTLTEHFTDHPTEPDGALQAFYFDALHLQRMADLLDAHSMVDITQTSSGPHQRAAKPGDSVVCIRNVVPAPFLQPRITVAHTSTLFSATLQPARFYADLLGLPEDHVWVDVESPFAAHQLQVQVARHISTRYPHRAASLAPIAALMAQQFRERPGNYLAFFSSYDYLQQAAALFAQQHPDVPHWCQSRRMLEGEQREFLARFTDTSQGIAFAVLGGAFAEGIDLPGQRLIGAFVATLGLPQVNPVNEQIRERMQALFGAGYDYTYLYPGLQKVVQAAGRVIRTPSDEGVVHLMDERFAQAQVRSLLPAWWQTR